MTVTTISSREFNQHISEAKKAANKGPLFITDRGRPAHVLLSMKDYGAESPTGPKRTLSLSCYFDASRRSLFIFRLLL